MKPADKGGDYEMERFVKGETHNYGWLQPVIEVGVNVPNSRKIIGRAAETVRVVATTPIKRLGLRGADQSFCITNWGKKKPQTFLRCKGTRFGKPWWAE